MNNQIFKCHSGFSMSAPSGGAAACDIVLLDHFFDTLTQGNMPFIDENGFVTAAANNVAGSFRCVTGGTTSHPKIIQRTCISWMKSFELHLRLYQSGLSDHSYAVLGSLKHSLALFAAIEAAHIGAKLYLLHGLLPNRQIAVLSKNCVQTLYATPTQIRVLLALQPQHGELSALRFVFIGGGAIAKQDLDEFQKLAPNAIVHQFYGAAETSFITMSDYKTPLGSVGRAYPNVEIRIGSSPQNTHYIKESGPIWVKSDYTFSGYIFEDNFQSRDDDGWISPGEIGYFDDNGYLYLCGRTNRMVTVSDKNVHPEWIESVLYKCKGVQLAAALAKPDPIRGNRFVAYVGGNENLDSEQLFFMCRQHLPKHACPSFIKIVPMENFPQLPSGKADLVQLQKWVLSDDK